MIPRPEHIADNLRRVRDRVEAAARRAGRRVQEIRLVGVCKGIDVERIRAATAAGLSELGENYVQEAREKIEALGAGATWHLVGHLQTNKAAAAVSLFDMIQTVDSVKLARAISRRCQQAGKTMPVLLEVNTSGEGSKFGMRPDELRAAAEDVAGLPAIAVQGLMTIGRLAAGPEDARPDFRLLASLASQAEGWGIGGFEMKWLSMGMTADFEVAIEEGANLVRVGTGIFGPRANIPRRTDS
jgi:pyridoxal phosphate enzyme (YggS family)